MVLNVGDIVTAKLHLKEMPEIKVGVYLLVDSKEPKFLLLNMPHPNELKVNELLPTLSLSDISFAGGSESTDKVYYLHKFKSVRNSKKISKDLYFLGDFSEIELIDKHGKLSQNNCRFYLGYYTTNLKAIDENKFKKIGSISSEEIFLPFDEIQDYWEKVYVNYLIDSSGLKNIDSASIDSTETPSKTKSKSFIKSFLWTKSWLILSALMNAISLINIGVDLKVVTIKWIAFFDYALNFVRNIAQTILYPLSYLLNLINIEIPVLIKDIFLLTSILLTSLMRAFFERDRKFRKGTAATTTKRKWGKYITLTTKALSQILIGTLGGLLTAGVTWGLTLLIGSHAITMILTILGGVLVILSIPSSNKAKNIEVSFVKDTMRFYVFTIIFFLMLIILINWYFITYNSN